MPQFRLPFSRPPARLRLMDSIILTLIVSLRNYFLLINIMPKVSNACARKQFPTICPSGTWKRPDAQKFDSQ
jgi:hypothetical protein